LRGVARQLRLEPGDDVSAAPRALIAVADDLFGIGLARVLSDEGVDVVARVESARAAADAIHEVEVDVVLLEMRRPSVGGVAVARLREVDGGPSVLALSAAPDDREAVAALAAGASAYLPMDADPATLAAAVRTVHGGGMVMTGDVADGVLAPLRSASPATNGEELAGEPLTARERDVLRRVADGLPNDAIARELVVTTSTVKNHIARIVAKLGARNRTHAAVLGVHRRYV
jgi:DNA-binding NarL/FixJ family response regulator